MKDFSEALVLSVVGAVALALLDAVLGILVLPARARCHGDREDKYPMYCVEECKSNCTNDATTCCNEHPLLK